MLHLLWREAPCHEPIALTCRCEEAVCIPVARIADFLVSKPFNDIALADITANRMSSYVDIHEHCCGIGHQLL